VGGAAFGYHDTHLLESESLLRSDGRMSTAEAAAAETLHAVVLLVDFDDQPMSATANGAPADSVDLYFNRVMLFLSQMYSQMSDGLVTITWELSPRVYRLPQKMSWYGDDVDIATREAALVHDAVVAGDPEIQYTRYDRFLLFHAGAGQEADVNNNSSELIWSVFFRTIDFQYWLDAPPDCVDEVYSANCIGIRTDDIDPRTNQPFYVPHMTIVPETESQDGYDFGILGVVAHEFGHSFGLPDLYDTTAPDDFIFADSQGIGTFGLMGAGIWNENGFFPSEMEAWSKFYVGWLRPRVVRPDETAAPVDLDLAAIEHERRSAAVRIPLGGDEYFLIENRIRDYNGNGKFDFDDADANGVFDFWTDSYAGAEFDWFLPRELAGAPAGQDGSGLLIWHIDESIIRDLLLYNLVNAEALHKGVDLEEADGIQDLDRLQLTFEAFGDSRDSWWAPFATQFTPHSEPNTDGYGDAHSGIWITDISGPGATMTFTLGFRAPGTAEIGDLKPGWPRDLPGSVRDFNPVAGDLDGDGVLELAVCAVEGNDEATISGRVLVFRPDGTPFFAPGTGPALAAGGRLRAEPILVNLDADPRPELVWVTGDSLLAMKGDGSYLTDTGVPSAAPVPYFRLPADPGRIAITAGRLEPAGSSRVCGNGPASVAGDFPEILVPVRDPGGAFVRVYAVAGPREPGGSSASRVVLEELPGRTVHAVALADIDSVDGGLAEMVTSVRTDSAGYVAISIYDYLGQDCAFEDVRTVGFSIGDTVAFTAPVVGDLNRDGLEEVVVGDSNGFVHVLSLRVHSADGVTKELGPVDADKILGSVLFDDKLFQTLPGWPVEVGTLADDALSLADVDGDGYLEVLVFGPANTLHVLNYNGTHILTLPVTVPGEDRFTEPFLSPLVLDLDGVEGAEMLLPLPDGQVRAHDSRGRAIAHWSYLGGGNQQTYPVVADLDGNGKLDLVTVEDITVGIPEGGTIQNGDEAPIVDRRGRVVVREVSEGTAQGPWPVYRGDVARSGRAIAPSGDPPDQPDILAEAFVMPNPVVRRQDTGFHYRIRSDVQRVIIEILDPRGEPVRTLEGTILPGTDNLVRWNLDNENGDAVAPGIYLARFEARAGESRDVRVQPFVVVR
jgi:M6 family metalloprotease-like protein